MSAKFDVAVIGAGIVGLAHAWMAVRRGLRVLLLDRSPAAQGATVRNFGMVWPIGQPAGELQSIARRARALWLELGAAGVLDTEPCGSIHLAHQPDELAVLEEFSVQQSFDVEMLSPAEVLRRSPLANPTGLLGGMWSPTELRVNPRTAAANIARWLREIHQVEIQFQTQITRIDDGHLHASDRRSWRAERIILCSGSDLQTLEPELFQQSGLKLCKLQMLRSVSQPSFPAQRPHLASGLTLRHYTSFRSCPSLSSLQQRVAAESPELDQYGIHVMASQFSDGEVVLGDSHEYDADIAPFDKQEIDDLILRECRKVFILSDWTIRERWHGIYAKHPEQPIFRASSGNGIEICVGTGGAGMTMAFGLAERAWRQWV